MKKVIPSRNALRELRVFQAVYGYTTGWRLLYERFLATGQLPTIRPRWEAPEPSREEGEREARTDSPAFRDGGVTVREVAAGLGTKVYRVIAAGHRLGWALDPGMAVSPGLALRLRREVVAERR